VVERLAAHGLGSTIGYAAEPGESPRSVAAAYGDAFGRLRGLAADCYVSVKASMLGFDAALVRELAANARRTGRRLHFDALAPEAADRIWSLLEAVPPETPLGTTLPGRWRRSIEDAARARELGLHVRVVKGQWPDDDRALDPAEGFLGVVQALSGDAAEVALATHDMPLLERALRRRSGPCSVELFYGLPLYGPALAARRAGVPIRVYVPYGSSGPPYRGAALVRNPAAAWWLTQDLLLGEEKAWRDIRRLQPSR